MSWNINPASEHNMFMYVCTRMSDCQWKCPSLSVSKAPSPRLRLQICHVANEYIEENLHNKLCVQEHYRKKRSTWHSATNPWHSVLLYIFILREHVFLPPLWSQQKHDPVPRVITLFFIITKRDKKARNNVIRACLTGLSAEHNEYLQHHLAHSFLPHIGPSLYSTVDPHRVTQQESKSYFRNSAHSRSSKMEDALWRPRETSGSRPLG